jgi:hypothetical protein
MFSSIQISALHVTFPNCVAIVSVFLADKELAAVWRTATRLLNIGVLHMQQLLDQTSSGLCAYPLYVVLSSGQQILSEVRYLKMTGSLYEYIGL